MAAKSRPVNRLRVLRTERLTPHMIRIVAGGEDLAKFRSNPFTDTYIKVVFPVPGVSYPEPLDLGVIREQLPGELAPKVRSYTVRSYDEAAGEVAIDFVHHGDEG